jgi:hypothetical protein
MVQLMRSKPAMRTRILISVVIGMLSGWFCWLLMVHFQQGAGDFAWTLWSARWWLAGKNPYYMPIGSGLVQYPFTATFFGLPFVWMRPEVAAGTFYGISSALMAFGLTREGCSRLLVFLVYPYWAGFLTAQWPPLIMASAFFPLLLPATMVKPQIGLPVALTHLSRRGILACAALILLSLLLIPRWPFLWLSQLRNYQHFFPILVLPGPLLGLALLRYRDRDAWLLFLMACMPQRWFFDTLVLWLIPKTRREILATAFLSWIAGIWRWYHFPHSFNQVGRWTVLWIYLPMLAVLLLRGWENDAAEIGVASEAK